MSDYPKVLVISHNCFSKHGSNGRTLANFFIDWPKESLAQFYINNELPDSDVCENYYRVTDIEVLKAFIRRAKVGKKIENKTNNISNKESLVLKRIYKISKKRKPLNYLMRNLLWGRNKWKNKVFKQWIDEFDPELILLQLGDYSFMIRIALSLASEKNIPLIIYNSEDYYFKDKKSISPLYYFFRKEYKKQVEKALNYASYSIYNSQMLQDTYNRSFNHKSTVIMTSTELQAEVPKPVNHPIIISYLGNLGVGRHEPLIEIAKQVHSLDKNLYLDIYGNIPDLEVKKLLMECEGITIKGFVSYEKVIQVLRESDLLVHAENFSEFYQWDLRHAFSTKIADSLASGTCFFMYAPENMAATRYLKKNSIAFVANSKKQMEEIINNLISDNNLRKRYINNAQKLVRLNHDIHLNINRFRKLVISEEKEFNENSTN